MKISVIFFFILILPFFSVANEYLPETHYRLQWHDKNDIINNVDIFLAGNGIDAKAMSGDSNEKKWSLKDYVSACDLDIMLDIIPESFEAIDLFNDNNKVVLFAYKIGCVGGIDPVDVKYFAFYKGKKYALRGQEMFIESTGVDENYIPPTPDDNLRHNELLLKYMKKKWPSVALRIMF